MSKFHKTVFVAMSGGVDSSVAAYLLSSGGGSASGGKKRGYNVVGVFMRCYNLDGCAERDAEDARRVAEHLNIPFYVWDFEKEYKKDVVKYMIDGYRRGLTPNPDVMCNRQIKFGLFFKKAVAAGADYVATGHYVRLQPEFPIFNSQFSTNFKIENSMKIKNYKLKIAKDLNKDQSYFLWTLTQEQLSRCLFPIGDYLKPRVREIARHAGLPTANKKDSQGVCFLGKFSVADFLKQHIKPKKGAVVTTNGEKIGEHDGAWFYTIGQRHGLNLSSKQQVVSSKGNAGSHYVAGKNIKTNTITVAEGENNPALYKKEIALREVNFISPQHSHILKNMRMLRLKGESEGGNYSLIRTNKRIVGISVMARVRYRQPLAEATLIISSPSRGEDRRGVGRESGSPSNSPSVRGRSCRLVFKKPVKFVAPGQSAVFYSKNGEMLGGGVIATAT